MMFRRDFRNNLFRFEMRFFIYTLAQGSQNYGLLHFGTNKQNYNDALMKSAAVCPDSIKLGWVH